MWNNCQELGFRTGIKHFFVFPRPNRSFSSMTKVSFPDNCLSMQKIIFHKINDSTKHLWPGYTLLQIFCLSPHWQGAISTSSKENSYLGVLVYCFHDPAESRKGYLIKTITSVTCQLIFEPITLFRSDSDSEDLEWTLFKFTSLHLWNKKAFFAMFSKSASTFNLLTRSCNSRNTVFRMHFPIKHKVG